MAWVKLDDGFPDHRKLAELGAYAPLCGWLYVCGLAYCNRQLTDGRIPKVHVRRLAGFEYLSIETGEIPGMASFGETVEADHIASLLVQAGLWEDAGQQYVVHDYLSYQPSRNTVLKERAQAAERKERWKERRGNAVPNGEGTAREQRENKPPDPDPDPDPGTGTGTDPSSSKNDDDDARARESRPSAVVVAAPLVMSPKRFEQRRRECAFVGSRLDVPNSAHEAFRRSLGGTDPESALQAWYVEINTAADISGEPVPSGREIFPWLQERFDNWASKRASASWLEKRRQRRQQEH